MDMVRISQSEETVFQQTGRHGHLLQIRPFCRDLPPGKEYVYFGQMVKMILLFNVMCRGGSPRSRMYLRIIGAWWIIRVQ